MCGIFGIRSEEREVARVTYFGLFALQHRGQEAAGIAVSDEGRLTVLRDLGLVAQVFDEEKLQALAGQVAIGHTRYSTTGSNAWTNVQPLLQPAPAPSPLPLAVAQTMARLEGAYSIVALADDALVAFRDPHGIRPLSLGRLGGGWGARPRAP